MSYDKHPVLRVSGHDHDCAEDWAEVAAVLHARIAQRDHCIVAVECYPGVDTHALRAVLDSTLSPSLTIDSESALLMPDELERLLRPLLGDDPVFGFMCDWVLEHLFSPSELRRLERLVTSVRDGIALVVGAGATLVAPQADVLIYADLTRWEIQQRQRRRLSGNLGARNANSPAHELYKRSYFVDWRLADRKRSELFKQIDFYLDTNEPDAPRLISGDLYRHAFRLAATRPFRLVPFFDPGVWGGEWMRREFDLADDAPNFAWGFDCVPEENSLIFAFGSRRLQTPALPLVHEHPEALLGPYVSRTFGAEFPIRFDLLDTMAGGNLSLQVHPLRSYIAEKFGMPYTQDESYYILDAQPGSIVYLGLKEKPDAKSFEEDLRRAESAGWSFPVDAHIQPWLARKHDHFSIPSGTIHSSGRDNVVLEISATPYIFTFKLWDWGRNGLDGRPRPTHIEHGLANVQWNRTTSWVSQNLVSPIRTIGAGDGWREEKTGLHDSEFIETRRHFFNAPVEHDTRDTLNVLNLVEGTAAIVESPTDAFEPLWIHYAETFVVPAAVGRYRIRPADRHTGTPMATIKASVRESWFKEEEAERNASPDARRPRGA